MTAFSRRRSLGALAALACTPFTPCRAAAGCATSIDALRGLFADPAFPLKWYETTMDDDKPLVLSILEKQGVLSLEFVKTGEGLWAEAAGVVCSTPAGLEARFTADQVRIGPACGFAARLTLSGGGQFLLTRIEAQILRVQAGGWNGLFSSRQPR